MTGRSGDGSAGLPPLRWLSNADVVAAMPPLEERLRLAELTMVALARPGAAELPPKIAIHPRPAASFVHAMPSHLRGDEASGDLVGMKWVAGYATNAALGLPGIHATVIVNDPGTGIPTAILDGGPITAERTAAVSGVGLRHLGPPKGTPVEIAMIGAGVQGRSHLAVFAGLLPGARLRIFDRSPERASALASEAGATPGIAAADVASTARDAVAGADVVFSAASFGPAEERQSMTNEWLREDATVIPIDYATYCAAEVARDAALFVVDQREQYLANRDAGNFDGYPDPMATIGEAILAGTTRPEGRVVITHLGVGLADLVFADAIVRAAEEAGIGTVLPR
ncbi:MAG TPA: NAD(P)-binding domain-containing protein [Candidatus Limnocylindrales bacterium]|nr:NAD(P)-binding domain-containing protein [Candidatus Limnocylindrales bacterium]